MGRRTSIAEKWLRMANPDLSRVLGWALLVFSLLLLNGQLAAGRSVSLIFVLPLALGIGLMIKAMAVVEEGETKKNLKFKHLDHTLVPALHLHHARQRVKKLANHTSSNATRLSSDYVLNLIIMLTLAITVVSLALFVPILFVCLSFSAAVYVILLGLVRRSVTTLGVGLVIGLAILFNISQWYGADALYATEQIFLSLLAALMVILAVFCLGNIQRTHQNYISARAVLVTAVFAYLITTTGLAVTGRVDNLGYALLTLAAMLGPAAAFAWVRFERASFAKYIAVVAVLAILVYAYLFMSTVSITLLWFISAVVFFMFGFGLPSYSARMLGLSLLGGAAAHYMLLLAPESGRVVGPLWLQENLWLGILLTLFMLLVAGWYNSISLRGVEGYLRPALRRFLLVGAYGILTVMVLSSSDGLSQSFALSLLGLVGAMAGVLIRSRWTIIGGAAVSLLGLIDFLIIVGV